LLVLNGRGILGWVLGGRGIPKIKCAERKKKVFSFFKNAGLPVRVGSIRLIAISSIAIAQEAETRTPPERIIQLKGGVSGTLLGRVPPNYFLCWEGSA
jgi:hypothetical protein